MGFWGPTFLELDASSSRFNKKMLDATPCGGGLTNIMIDLIRISHPQSRYWLRDPLSNIILRKQKKKGVPKLQTSMRVPIRILDSQVHTFTARSLDPFNLCRLELFHRRKKSSAQGPTNSSLVAGGHLSCHKTIAKTHLNRTGTLKRACVLPRSLYLANTTKWIIEDKISRV